MAAAILFGISASGSLSQGNSISAADLRNIQTLKSELDSMNNNALNPYLEIMKNMLFKISSDKDMYFNSAIATLRINTFDTQIFFYSNSKKYNSCSARYTWQYSRNGGTTWYNCTEPTRNASYVTAVTSINQWYLYRCIVTAYNNETRQIEVIGHSNSLKLNYNALI